MNIITGLPRSGTTLTAKVFQACGAKFKTNSLLLEHRRIRTICNGHLESMGFDPLGQGPLPTEHGELNVEIPDLEIVKQCKIVLMWSHFHRQFPGAKWVIVRRDRQKIIDSCLRTNFMARYNNRHGWDTMCLGYLKHLADLKQTVDYVEVWPEEFKASAEYLGMQRAVEFLGYNWNEKKAREQICQSKLR